VRFRPPAPLRPNDLRLLRARPAVGANSWPELNANLTAALRHVSRRLHNQRALGPLTEPVDGPRPSPLFTTEKNPAVPRWLDSETRFPPRALGRRGSTGPEPVRESPANPPGRGPKPVRFLFRQPNRTCNPSEGSNAHPRSADGPCNGFWGTSTPGDRPTGPRRPGLMAVTVSSNNPASRIGAAKGGVASGRRPPAGRWVVVPGGGPFSWAACPPGRRADLVGERARVGDPTRLARPVAWWHQAAPRQVHHRAVQVQTVPAATGPCPWAEARARQPQATRGSPAPHASRMFSSW